MFLIPKERQVLEGFVNKLGEDYMLSENEETASVTAYWVLSSDVVRVNLLTGAVEHASLGEFREGWVGLK